MIHLRRKHAAKTDDQTSAKRKGIDRLVGIDAPAIIVVEIISASCRSDRREELGLELDAHTRRTVDVHPQLETRRKIGVGRITGRLRCQDIGAEQKTQKWPHRRTGNITGKYKSTHDIILVQVAACDLTAPVISVVEEAR